jgi:hypothetical protein
VTPEQQRPWRRTQELNKSIFNILPTIGVYSTPICGLQITQVKVIFKIYKVYKLYKLRQITAKVT